MNFNSGQTFRDLLVWPKFKLDKYEMHENWLCHFIWAEIKRSEKYIFSAKASFIKSSCRAVKTEICARKVLLAHNLCHRWPFEFKCKLKQVFFKDFRNFRFNLRLIWESGWLRSQRYQNLPSKIDGIPDYDKANLRVDL